MSGRRLRSCVGRGRENGSQERGETSWELLGRESKERRI